MKAIILTIGFVLTSMVAMSQYVETIRGEFPMEEWYTLPGEEFAGVQYITSDDEWIKSYLENLLKEDNISIDKPEKVEKQNGKIIYMEWNYTTSEGDDVNVSYINNGSISDISFYYFE